MVVDEMWDERGLCEFWIKPHDLEILSGLKIHRGGREFDGW
jgi:hypothetical protein